MKVIDPKVRIHGDYAFGSLHIHQGRVLVANHVATDDAFGVQVSRRRTSLPNGIVFTISHEYAETYLDIYAPPPSVLVEQELAGRVAYFFEYRTDVPILVNGSQLYNSYYTNFASADIGGSITSVGGFTYEGIGSGVGESNTRWDFCGNNKAIICGVNSTTNFTEHSISLVDTTSCSIIESVVSTTPAYGIVYCGKNNAVMCSESFSSSGNAISIYGVSTDNLSVTLLSTPVTGPSGFDLMPSLYGGVLLNGYRVLVLLYRDSANPTNYLASVSYDNGAIWSSIATANPIVPQANSQISASTDIVGSPIIAMSVPANGGYVVYWDGVEYLQALGNTYPIFNTEQLFKIIPVSNGVLLCGEDGIVYFEKAGAYSIAPNSGSYTGTYLTTATTRANFKQTITRGLYNFSTNQLATLSSSVGTISNATRPQQQVGQYSILDYIYDWVPIIPGDWVDYLGIYV